MMWGWIYDDRGYTPSNSGTVWYNTVLFLQLFSGLREQGLLFSDFSDELCDLEEGAEYNKVP